MRATFAGGNRMDLVDDHGSRGLEHGAPRLRAEQDVKRLWSGHDDMGRTLGGALALSLRRIARAHPRADSDIRKATVAQRLANAGQRHVEIAMDVVRERFQRRDIDDLSLVRQPTIKSLAYEAIGGTKKGGERLPGTGWCRDQHISSRGDRGPRF